MTLISLDANRIIKVAVGNLVLALQHVLNNNSQAYLIASVKSHLGVKMMKVMIMF